MPSRPFIGSGAVWLTVALCCLGSACVYGKSAQRPNFIFILLDDMGYGDLSCYGGVPGSTPNLDRIAKEGLRFSQFYVASPICSPSRIGFTTGQHPARWNITSYLASRDENARRGIANWLDPNAPSIARILKSGGYATAHIGKWHMGGQRDVGDAPLITEYGFDESLTQFEGLGNRILPLLDAFDGQEPRKHGLGSDKLGRGEIQWMDRSTVTSAYVDRAIQFMRKARSEGKPFYLNVWPDDVHSPFYPPKNLRGDSTKRQLYLGVLKAADAHLGALFDFLRATPDLSTNTVLIISSDNGPEPGAGKAGPFRGAKGTLYEGGIRTPLIIWGPGWVKRSAWGSLNSKTVVSATDLFPSLLAIANAAAPENLKFDGEDMSDVLLGRPNRTRSTPIYWVRPPDRPGQGEALPDMAMRQGDWKLLMMRDGSNPQLYNLGKDPSESNNLAGRQPRRIQKMSRDLQNWREASAPRTNTNEKKL